MDNDFTKRTSNGLFADGWIRFDENWRLSGKHTSLSRDVDRGYETAGNRQTTRNLLSLRYSDKTWGMVEGRIEKRVKEYELLATKLDYTSGSLSTRLNIAGYGTIAASYDHNYGDYKNSAREYDYEFSDDVITVSVIPQTFNNVKLQLNGTYFYSDCKCSILPAFNV